MNGVHLSTAKTDMLIAALRNHTIYESGNTRCDVQGNVFLYGHHIARGAHHARDLEFNLCGYPTRTTIARLNLLADLYGFPNIRLQGGTPHRGPRTKAKLPPCPKGVDPKAHEALHHKGNVAEELPTSGWFDASGWSKP